MVWEQNGKMLRITEGGDCYQQGVLNHSFNFYVFKVFYKTVHLKN